MKRPYKDDARAQYRNQKWYNHGRGIPFLLTFEQWMKIWIESGHYDKRGGRDPSHYCMARGTSENPDTGPYVVGNVRIITNRENRSEQDTSYMTGNKHAKGSKHTKSWRSAQSARLIGNSNAAKLTVSQVRHIKRLGEKLSMGAIAKKFKVSYTTVYDILKRGAWKRV